MLKRSILFTACAAILFFGTEKLLAEANPPSIVADHQSACRESEQFTPRGWFHDSVTPIENFTSTWAGSAALVLNQATERFIMPNGSRAYPRKAYFESEPKDAKDVQSGTMLFTLPGRAILKKNQSLTMPPFENVRIGTKMEMGPGIGASCHIQFSKPVAYCETVYPDALVPPPFEVQDCKLIGSIE